jgi:hypothetical protein
VPKVFDAATVDLVTMLPDGAGACLYIVQDLAWSGSDEQLVSLQEKVHNYVGFALDGEMAAQYPGTSGLPWRIVIDSQAGRMDARTAELVELLVPAVSRYGGELVAG